MNSFDVFVIKGFTVKNLRTPKNKKSPDPKNKKLRTPKDKKSPDP